MARSTPPPRYEPNKLYVLKGRTLNDIWAAIRAGRPVTGVGTNITQRPNGTMVNLNSASSNGS